MPRVALGAYSHVVSLGDRRRHQLRHHTHAGTPTSRSCSGHPQSEVRRRLPASTAASGTVSRNRFAGLLFCHHLHARAAATTRRPRRWARSWPRCCSAIPAARWPYRPATPSRISTSACTCTTTSSSPATYSEPRPPLREGEARSPNGTTGMASGFDRRPRTRSKRRRKANYAAAIRFPEYSRERTSRSGRAAVCDAGGQPRSPYNGESNNFMPRIGLAWQITPEDRHARRLRHVLRLHRCEQIGRLSIRLFAVHADPGLARQRPDLRGQQCESVPERPDGSRSARPAAWRPTSGRAWTSIRRSGATATRNAGSLGLQRQFGEFVLDAAYVGNRGTRAGDRPEHQRRRRSQYLSTSPFRDQATDQLPRPSVPESVPRHQSDLRREHLAGQPAAALPAVRRHRDRASRSGYSWYHSLQARGRSSASRSGYTFNSPTRGRSRWKRLNPERRRSRAVRDRSAAWTSRTASRSAASTSFRSARDAMARPFAPEGASTHWPAAGSSTRSSSTSLAKPLGFGNALFIGDDRSTFALTSSERDGRTAGSTPKRASTATRRSNCPSNYRTFPLRFCRRPGRHAEPLGPFGAQVLRDHANR